MFRLVLIAVAVVECLGSGTNLTQHQVHPGLTQHQVYPAHTGHNSEYRTPYYLELELYNHLHATYDHHCEASIISYKMALTAASCTHGTTPYMVRFRHDNAVRGTGGTLHQAERILAHEKYQTGSSDYNIALVTVKDFFPNKSVIRVAVQQPRAGLEAVSTGWGFLPGTNSRPIKVRHAAYPVFDHEACHRQQNPKKPITERILCAGHLGENQLDCGADFGGPLVVNDYLVGIVISSVCGSDPNTMGVFTNVANLHKWIGRVITYEDAIDLHMD